MVEDYNAKLSAKCREIVECDTTRIRKTGDKLFLIIGFNRSTKDDDGQWVEHYVDENGDMCQRLRDWDYVAEKVVASGKTEDELIVSAEYYKRLCSMTIWEFLKENTCQVNTCSY
ncbi:hypothetical protein KKI24_09035 [bacterium]|nr:hypothetical protein [bacterium]